MGNLADDIPELRERVEALALCDDPASLAKLLRKRLAGIKRRRRFVHYRESSTFAQELEGWLADVREGLLETDSKAALGLFEDYIRADKRIRSPQGA